MKTQNYINGQWRDAQEGRTFPSLNPTTGEVLAQVARSGPADVDAAVEAARQALPAWKATPAPFRANFLFRIAELAQDREDDMARFIAREYGKTLEDAHGDAQELIHVALYWMGEGRRQFAQMAPSEKREKLGFSRREPLGVVVALTPSNFSFTKAALKIFPAIVLGNTVVHKPSRETPLIGAAFQEILDEAGLPPGVVNMTLGLSEEIGDRLVEHPGVDMISYTGETRVGRSIARRAGERLAPVSLEMNAKNALIVNADADLKLALDWAVKSAYATNGQRETAASRIILHEAIADAFTAAFVERVKGFKVGDPLDAATNIGPLASAAQVEALDNYVQRARAMGGRILIGGQRPDDPALAQGFFYLPTVLTDIDPYSEHALEEVFGPSTTLFRVANLDEAIKIANAAPYILSTAIFTTSMETAMKTADQFEAGVAWINCGTVGAEVGTPFQGSKAYGIGTTEWGQGAIDTFTRWKTTYINYSSEHRFVFEDTRLR
ncbi:MAG: aldehyde dehydrogenase family protein [Anaerolineae bacterium]